MGLEFRDAEIELLRRQRWISEEQHSRMTLVSGRHLSGKTALVSEAYSDKPFLYFKLGGKTEPLSVAEFVEQTVRKMEIYVPKTALTFRLLLDFLYKTAAARPLTVVLDNFDEYIDKDPEFYTALGENLKKSKRYTRLNLVVLVSNPFHEERLFGGETSPLRKCLDMDIRLGFFKISQMKALLDRSGKAWTREDLLTLYMLTGGCPKFFCDAVEAGPIDRKSVLDRALATGSPWMDGVKRRLAETMGHNSEVYLSLLELTSQGCDGLGAMQKRLAGIIVGGHLMKLENDYGLVAKTRPVLADKSSRNVVRYEVTDQYMDFWFRYIAADRSEADAGDFAHIRSRIDEDWNVYAKKVLKRYFRQMLAEENGISPIGGDWKSGKEKTFELDIVGLDSKTSRALVADVELSAENFDKDSFLGRVIALRVGALKGWNLDTRLFTLNDM